MTIIMPFTPRRQIIAKIKKKQQRKESWQQRWEKLLQFIKAKKPDFGKGKFLNRNFFQLLKQWAETTGARLKSNLHKLKLSYKNPFQFAKAKQDIFQIGKLFTRGLLRIRETVYQAVSRLKPSLSLGQKLTKWRNNLLTSLSNLFWKRRFIFLVLGLIMLGSLNLNARLHNYRLGMQNWNWYQTNLWPTLPHVFFKYAQQMFNLGNEPRAQQLTTLGQKHLESGSIWGAKWWWSALAEETNNLLNGPQQRREQLQQIAQLKQKYPYSWQLITYNYWFAMELLQADQASHSASMIHWLNPQINLATLVEVQ